MKATISRWGNSLAIRIPKDVLEEARLSEGDQVSITSDGAKLVLVRADRPSLEELVAKITPENRHAESFTEIVGNELW